MSGPAARWHPGTWAVWFAAAMIIVLVTSNPLYHATIVLCALVVYAGVRSREKRALDALLAIGLAFSLLSIPLNLVTGSSGATELFTLPELELPGWFGSVTLGGVVTAESLVYAAGHALALAAIIALVCAFNAGVDHFQLLRLSPPGLAQIGVVVTVGLLIVPETLARAASLREARVTRGYEAGWRSAPSLAIPLLSDALERAVQRAESLDARGFGALARPPSPLETVAALTGLFVAAVGAFSWYYAGDARSLSALAMLAGAAMLLAAVWRQAARGPGRRLFVPPVRASDIAIAAAALVALGVFIALRIADLGDVTYLPFPELHAPAYSLAAAAALLLLLAPIFAEDPA